MTQANPVLVVKLGGEALVDLDHLGHLFQVMAEHKAATGQSIVVVHGGGLFVDDLIAKLGFSVEKKQGLRVTPK
ncbi:MAG: acetylglutamate kinase, partial [Vibrio sp.]